MVDVLGGDDAEREIFLRALREYSENCEAPNLNLSCPYAIETGPGIRGCAEECMDILGRHGAPPPVEELDIGNNITVRRARRPRPRRSRASAAKAFDAREIYLADKGDGPPPRWRLSSVIQGLTDLVRTPPPADPAELEERLSEFRKLGAIAEARGMDFDEQLMPHLRTKVVGAVLGSVMLSRTSTSEPAGELARWKSLADEHLGPVLDEASVEQLGGAVDLMFGPIITWARTCSDDDLLNWVAPEAGALNTGPVDFEPPDLDGYWLIERLTKTYLSDWSTESLKREWKYIHGQLRPPCAPAELTVREVLETDLALVMADRLVSRREQPMDLASSMVEPAANFLEEGRRLEAAALFEAALRRDPSSGDALNNLGFCLLPDYPERALEYIERALQQGPSNPDVPKLNRILALAALGRRTSSTDLVNAYLEEGDSTGRKSTSTWLWDIASVLGDGPPELVNVTDLHGYAESLARLIASDAAIGGPGLA